MLIVEVMSLFYPTPTPSSECTDPLLCSSSDIWSLRWSLLSLTCSSGLCMWLDGGHWPVKASVPPLSHLYEDMGCREAQRCWYCQPHKTNRNGVISNESAEYVIEWCSFLAALASTNRHNFTGSIHKQLALIYDCINFRTLLYIAVRNELEKYLL